MRRRRLARVDNARARPRRPGATGESRSGCHRDRCHLRAAEYTYGGPRNTPCGIAPEASEQAIGLLRNEIDATRGTTS